MWQQFLKYDTQSTDNKRENINDLIQTKNLCANEDPQQTEKATHRTGGSICKSHLVRVQHPEYIINS